MWTKYEFILCSLMDVDLTVILSADMFSWTDLDEKTSCTV